MRQSKTDWGIEGLEDRSRRVARLAASLMIGLALAGSTAGAQERTPANCTYESCALGLTPVWNGLAITRGISQRPIANLGFFWPEDVRPVFADNSQALEAAEQALQTRTVGAILTDAGLVLLGTGLARAGFQREFDGLSRALVVTGATSIGVSIPFQFAADGYLSRAIWWHNRRFSR